MEKKKKILIVTAFPTHGAGSGALITTQAKSYIEDGHEVVIITGNNRTDFDKLEGVRYHIVPFKGETEDAEKIEGQCNFNYLMFTTHTESTANFWNASIEQIEEYMKAFETAISEEVKMFNPDIIHAQHNWITSSLLSKFNKPVVLTIHGTDLMGYKKSKEKLEEVNEKIRQEKQKYANDKNEEKIKNIEEIEKIYEKYSTKQQILKDIKEAIDTKNIKISKEELSELIKLYDENVKYQLYMRNAENSANNSNRIIVISDDQKREFVSLFPNDKEKVELLENGYDPKTFYVDKNVEKGDILSKENRDYDNLILFVGKFADFKGIDALLNAVKIYEGEMERVNKKVQTVIVGSGALDEKLKKQAEKLELKHTYFLGRKNHEEIRKLQNLSDVSVIPSRNEPFGLVVIEGTACGHPVIATNAGGIPGILNTDNKDISNKSKLYKTPLGILVPPLPERPLKLNDEQKDKLDEYITEYCIVDEDKKSDIINEISENLKLEPSEIKEYIDRYMKTVNGISDGVEGIALGKIKFDNDKIANYTEEHYSQDIIRNKIIGIFDSAIKDYQAEQIR